MIASARGASRSFDPIRRGLVAYWKMEEATGTRFDASGNGNHLTSNNSVGQADGEIGKAASFVSASSQSLSIASNASLQLGAGSFTVAGWFYLNSVGTKYLLSKSVTNADTTDEYQLLVSGGVLEFFTTDGVTSKSVIGPTPPALNVWHHFVMAYDAPSKIQSLYMDGVINPTNGSRVYDRQGYVNTAPLTVGSLRASFFLDGRIDELGLWSKSLLVSEWSRLRNNGNAHVRPGGV